MFLAFLRLGCTSFGGPIAHLGYFRNEIVERRRWCSERSLAEIIALAQALPGPASSQAGFALGILRAGPMGGLAAWLGFTLPSAVLMLLFAYGHFFLSGGVGRSVVHGLQLVAVGVVAQAVLAMQRTLAPDRLRLMVAAVGGCVAFFLPVQLSTLAAIAWGAVAGLVFCRAGDWTVEEAVAVSLPKSVGIAAGVCFCVLLVVLPAVVIFSGDRGLAVFAAFYRSGALVFGGGHVVLPLLEDAVVARGWVTQPVFLAGYGAAQALPGPLFSFGAYLGACVRPSASPMMYGLLGLAGIFLPGLLAMAAVLPFWGAVRGNGGVRAALRGVNASVVGVLLAAFCRPLWTSTIHGVGDFLIALAVFAMLVVWRAQPWMAVAGAAAAAVLLRMG